MIRQRRKLYKSEDKGSQPWRWFASPEAAQMWLDQRVARKWWRQMSDIRHAVLKYPSPGGMSGAVKEGNVLTISVRPASLCTSTLIHELAHGLVWVPGNDPERDHGPKYAGALIEAYRHLEGAEVASAVAKAFDESGVRYDPFP